MIEIRKLPYAVIWDFRISFIVTFPAILTLNHDKPQLLIEETSNIEMTA